MFYRTRTYIAGDWDHDSDAVNQLHKWNDSEHWSLSFTDAHDLMQARDTSNNCSIKASLKTRMDASARFVLIVGNSTDSVTAGGCQLCKSYDSYLKYCVRSRSVDYRSYIKFECDKAVEAGIKIIVLYKAAKVEIVKCPEAVRYRGIHVPMCYRDNGKLYWDYNSVKRAFDESDNC